MRALTFEIAAELQESRVRPFVLFYGDFVSGPVRVWSGYGDLSWGGHTWVGTGHLGSVSPIQETANVQAVGIQVTLSGIPVSNLELVLAEVERGRIGTVYLGFFDADGTTIIADPYPVFSGRLDQPAIEDSGETATVNITYEGRLVDMQRQRVRFYDSEDQQISHPGDKGFDFVPSIQEWNGTWGR